MVSSLRVYAAILAWLLLAVPLRAREFFAAPQGRAHAQGTAADPWDIETALAANHIVRPGDVVWLRGGTYALEQPLRSVLAGSEQSPILVRQFPGERATLDCRLITARGAGSECLVIKSVNTWYWGFEITNSTAVRTSATVGSTGNPRGIGIQGQGGPGTKLINLVIHDVGSTLFESQRSGIEIYGVIAYNSGWEGPDRSHGPGFYVRNRSDSPRKVLRDNIVFQHYRQGLQGYGTFENVFSNFLLEGNVFFNNGIGGDGFHRNLMFGNENVDHRNNVFRENFTYFADGAGAGANTLGSAAGGCEALTITGNVFAHGPGRTALEVNNCAHVQISGNLFFGKAAWYSGAAAAKGDRFHELFPDNHYYGDGLGIPRGTAAFLRPNLYEPRRANLIVYNWDRLASVFVDLTPLHLGKGDRYEIHSVQDYFGRPLRGVYQGGPLEVPMTGWNAVPPIGDDQTALPSTFPDFGVFVVTWEGPRERPDRRRAR